MQNYKGYVKEILTYISYMLRQKKSPNKKFLLFGYGRSGSNLLVSLLDSHPLIHCDNELFLHKVFSPNHLLYCKERLSTKDVYGFKFVTYQFYTQGINDPIQYMSELNKSGYLIINLKRRNILRQAISVLYAVHRNKFHHKVSQGVQNQESMMVDMGKLQQELSYIEDLLLLEEKILENLPYLRVFYEDDLQRVNCHQSTIDKICCLLEIPSAPVYSDYTQTTPRDLSTFIENYEELKNFLSNTDYFRYLDD